MKVKNKNVSSELIEDIPIMKKQSGFSLIEVLVALAIFSVGVLAIAAMQVMAIKGNSFSNHLTEATAVAGDRMERLMNLNYNHFDLSDVNIDGVIGLDDTDDPLNGADHNQPHTSETNVTYVIYWNVAANFPAANTKTIRMIVMWTEGGAQKSVTLDLIKTN